MKTLFLFLCFTVSIQAATLGGQIRGVFSRGVFVELIEHNQVIRTARVNPFGYYRFYDLPSGGYIIVPVGKQALIWSPEYYKIDSAGVNLMNLDFLATY